VLTMLGTRFCGEISTWGASSAPKTKKSAGEAAAVPFLGEVMVAVCGAQANGLERHPPWPGSHRDLYLIWSSIYVTVATSLPDSSEGSDHGADRPAFAHRYRPPF